MATIPDARWGKQDGLLAKAGTAFASTRIGSRTLRALTPLDRKVLIKTMGRRTLLGPIGAPTMLLETIGRKSGQPRVTPLLFARDGESIIVVGSNFGQEHHPAWTGNLIANPEAAVIAGGARVPVRATLLEGDEAETAYRAMIEVTTVYAEYRNRTDRAIRIFRLTPA
jgi:deazaflavin-dependent oxidoreductase (nitroreductase family)